MATLCSSAALAATVIQVPADQGTIQSAIEVALDGDIVLVAPGTYLENIDFLGKAIAVQSVGGPLATTIDGSAFTLGPAFRSVVLFNGGEGNDSVLEGFTITGGQGTAPGAFPNGGGIYCAFSAPTLRNNIITGNSASSAGGGIYVIAGFGTQIINCVIAANSAAAGGGIYLQDASNTRIVHSTIVANSASFIAGALDNLGSPGTQLVNSILWANGAAPIYDTTALSITYSDVEGGWPGTGNTDAEPNFVSGPTGDYHLASNSPCIGAASAAIAGAPATDFEGDPRSACGAPDQGADERVVCSSAVFVRGDCNSDGNINIADPIFLLAFLFGVGVSPPTCADASDGNDDGLLNIADAIAILLALFAAPGPLPPPSICGDDPTTLDALECAAFAACP
ncbi:MAG: right-handed parallel beta-helix repeat-containing protein [Planctomycetota bacterium]